MRPHAQALGGAAVACALVSGIGLSTMPFQFSAPSTVMLFAVLGQAAGLAAVLALMEPSRLARDWFGWGSVMVLAILVVAELWVNDPPLMARLMDRALEAALLVGAWRVLHLVGRAPRPPLLAVAAAWLTMVAVVTIAVEPRIVWASGAPGLGTLLLHRMLSHLPTLAVLAFLLIGAGPWHGDVGRWSLAAVALSLAAVAAYVAATVLFSTLRDPPGVDVDVASWWIGLSRIGASALVASLAAGATALSLAALQPRRTSDAQPNTGTRTRSHEDSF